MEGHACMHLQFKRAERTRFCERGQAWDDCSGNDAHQYHCPGTGSGTGGLATGTLMTLPVCV